MSTSNPVKKYNKYDESCYLNDLSRAVPLRRLLEKCLRNYKLPMKPYDGKNGWESLFIEFVGAINYLFSEKNLRDHMKSRGLQSTTDWGYLYGEKDFRIIWNCRKGVKNNRYVSSFHIEYICDYLPIFKFFGKSCLYRVFAVIRYCRPRNSAPDESKYLNCSIVLLKLESIFVNSNSMLLFVIVKI